VEFLRILETASSAEQKWHTPPLRRKASSKLPLTYLDQAPEQGRRFDYHLPHREVPNALQEPPPPPLR